MAVYFFYLLEIEFYTVSSIDNSAPDLVHFLQVRSLLNQLSPELFVKLSRLYHCLLTESNMIIKSNNLNEIVFLFFILLEFILYYLFKTVNNKFFNKWWRKSFSPNKLLICFCVLMYLFHVKESEWNVEFGALGKFLYSLIIHSLYLMN